MTIKKILKIGKRYYDYNNGTLLIDNGFDTTEPEDQVEVISQIPMNEKYINHDIVDSNIYFQRFDTNYYSYKNEDREHKFYCSSNTMSLCRLKNAIDFAFCAMDIIPDYVQFINLADEKTIIVDVDAAVDEMNKIIEEEYKMFEETKGTKYPVNYYKIWEYSVEDDIDE